jgi:hypothetical protein
MSKKYTEIYNKLLTTKIPRNFVNIDTISIIISRKLFMDHIKQIYEYEGKVLLDMKSI